MRNVRPPQPAAAPATEAAKFLPAPLDRTLDRPAPLARLHAAGAGKFKLAAQYARGTRMGGNGCWPFIGGRLCATRTIRRRCWRRARNRRKPSAPRCCLKRRTRPTRRSGNWRWSALAVEPTAEGLARAPMQAHLQRGAHAEALGVYRRCRAALAQHMGLKLSPATEALRERIVAAASVGTVAA